MKNLFCGYWSLYFPYKSKRNCRNFQPNGLQDADHIKNRSRTIIYSPISAHKDVIFFSYLVPKTLTSIFWKWASSVFKLQNDTTRCRTELLGWLFFLMLVFTSTLWDIINISKSIFLSLCMIFQIASHIIWKYWCLVARRSNIPSTEVRQNIKFNYLCSFSRTLVDGSVWNTFDQASTK